MDMMPQPSIPNEVLPFVLGGAVWFGCCYLYVSPVLMQRAIDLHIADECQQGRTPALCTCVISDMTDGSGLLKNALFVSTFGLSVPSVSWWGNNKRNPVIEYASIQAKDRDRVKACGDGDALMTSNPMTTIEDAERRAKEELEAEYQAQKEMDRKRHDAEIEVERQARKKLEEDATAKAKQAAEIAAKSAAEAAEKAKDSPVGQYAQEQAEQAKRAWEINEGKTEELLSWAEIFLERSRQLREDAKRRWGVP